ncbi:MAG: hypothetical protein HZA91_02415 [Verrucomicrobia bacterium]|nr:hypothetical protein [Verrucomicrobiota bacterium]
MPELLAVYERDGNYFGVVAVTIGPECRHIEFGIPLQSYQPLRRILQSRPFDHLPGLRYRYFIAHSVSRVPDTELARLDIRIEQGSSGRQFPFDVPFTLAANLLWFCELKDFKAASHLRTVESENHAG